MLINIEDPPCVDVEDMDTSMSYYSGLLSDDCFNLDVGCSLPPDADLLQHLSSKLEIPVVLDEDYEDFHEDAKPLNEDSSNMTTDDGLLEPLLNLLDSEGAHWSMDSFPNLTAFRNDAPSEVKMEIKLEEPDSPANGLPPSPSSTSSGSAAGSVSGSANGSSSLEAWRLNQTGEPKVQLETPPISPPLGGDHSPPSSPQSATVSPLNISCINNIINDIQNLKAAQESSKAAPKALKVIPCARTINGQSAQRIQPRPENATPLTSAVTATSWSTAATNPTTVSTVPTLKTGEKRKTIVLSAKEFAALAYGARTTPARVATPVTSSSVVTSTSQTTIRVQPVSTPTLATQPLPAKVPLIPCQPLATSVPLTASFPITLASGTVMSTSPTTTSTIVSPIKCSSVPVKREMEIKAIKRQQRMIKNRESACLSRKKKKEYVTALEGEISKLQQENVQLKLENEALRQQVKDMESMSVLMNVPRSMIMSRSKKTATVLCAVFLLFTLNFGTFNGLVGKRMDSVIGDVASAQVEHHGRTLLWAANVDNSHEANSETSEPVTGDPDAVFPPNRLHPICPLHINRTESIRLDSELRRWIGVDVEAPQNVTQRQPVEEGNLLDWPKPPKWQSTKQTQNATVPHNVPSQDNSTAPSADSRTERRRKNQRRNKETNYASASNEVELYERMRPPLYEYAAFLDSFQRRQDTFYVVSFSGDHIILPARALNSSVRPKMSLVLPAMPFNATAPPHRPMTMMQIDCEVINTQLLQVKEADIPPHVRSHPAKEQENSRPSEGPSEGLSEGPFKDMPKRRKAPKVHTFANETAPHSYQNATANATSKMDQVKVKLFGNVTEAAVVTGSLTKANITGPTAPQSYRPYFVNSDYPEKFPPSKLSAAFLRSSYGSQNSEYPNAGKRVARFP